MTSDECKMGLRKNGSATHEILYDFTTFSVITCNKRSISLLL